MDLDAELRKVLSEDELEEQVKEKIKSFHGLLTREVALRLIAKEKGLLSGEEEKICRLNDVPKAGKKITFTAHVKKIWPVAKYSSGKQSRVVEVDDDTVTKPLVLWNQDVDIIKSIRTKDEIRVKGAYEKGGELHLGYNGSIEIVNKSGFSDFSELKDGESAHIRGLITSIDGPDRFVIDGKTVSGFSFMVSDGRSERRCVIIGSITRAGKIKTEDEVIIENARVDNGNVLIGDETRLLMRRLKDMIIGEVKRIRCEDSSVEEDGKHEKLFVKIGEHDVVWNRENALRFLDVQIADDIMISTVTALKKESLLNTKVAIKETNGIISRV
jgi:hypothetical protein